MDWSDAQPQAPLKGGVGGGVQVASRPDITILPAAASAWRTVVGESGSQVDLTDEHVDVPPLAQERERGSMISASAASRDGLRQSVSLLWKERWLAWARFERPVPLDLRPYLDGTLSFDLLVEDLAQGGVAVKLSFGENCERSVNLVEPARAWVGKGWQAVALPLSCFMRDSADFSQVRAPFSLEGSGTGRVSVANVRITAQALPMAGLTSCPDYRTESVTPAVQTEAFAIDWWLDLHEQQLQTKRRLLAAGTPPQIVFIGDSITQGWEQVGLPVWQRHFAALPALDLGIGGDRTENVLWRMQNGALDGLAPKLAVLMIGTNNAGARSAERTVAGVKLLIDEILQRLPHAKLLLLAIFPRGETPDDFLRQVNEGVNQVLPGFADGQRVHFLNINAALLEADGRLSTEVMPDLLHPNLKGYEIWQRAMAPTLQTLLDATH